MLLENIEYKDFFTSVYKSYCKTCKIENTEKRIKIKELTAEIKLFENLKNIRDKKIQKETNIYNEMFGNENYLCYACYDEDFIIPSNNCSNSEIKCNYCKNYLILYKTTNPDAFFSNKCEFKYLFCQKCKFKIRNEFFEYYI